MTDIINDPSHRLYGQARRLSIIIAQVFADFTNFATDYGREWGGTIYMDMEFLLGAGYSEPEMSREVIQRAIVATDNR